MMKLSILALLLLASCGGHKSPECWTKYKYEYNGYTYVEKRVIVCKPEDSEQNVETMVVGNMKKDDRSEREIHIKQSVRGY